VYLKRRTICIATRRIIKRIQRLENPKWFVNPVERKNPKTLEKKRCFG
jgi:hypothetical protein